MVIRDLTHTTASTHLDLPRDVSLEVQSSGRQLSADELEHSERYALIAWGISDNIRIGRLGAGLTIRQLAAACEIDPAQLSRIENGSAASNVSLEVLLRIARCLGLEIQQLLSAEFIDHHNPFKVETLDQTGGPGREARCCASLNRTSYTSITGRCRRARPPVPKKIGEVRELRGAGSS